MLGDRQMCERGAPATSARVKERKTEGKGGGL